MALSYWLSLNVFEFIFKKIFISSKLMFVVFIALQSNLEKSNFDFSKY